MSASTKTSWGLEYGNTAARSTFPTIEQLVAARFDRWLGERLGKPPTLSRPVLLICRNDAVTHSARIWAAERGGFLGLEITTLRALANALKGPTIEPEPALDPLPDNDVTRRIQGRAGLLDLARQHARAYRLAKAATGEVHVPPWLRDVGETRWEDDTQQERRLLELATQHGCKLTPSIRFHRVVTLGFEGHLDPWERATLAALGGTPHPDPSRSRPQQAIEVPDPAAEARKAVELARVDRDALILVHHPATAARVYRALTRNAVPCALRRATRLDRHTLAGVIRRCVPWFTGASDPPLRAVDLHEVLRHPMVGDELPEVARVWLEVELEAAGHDAHIALRPRGLAKAIRRARHLHAPLSAWIVEVEARSRRTDEPRLAADSLRLLARLKVLQACLRGTPFQDAFPVEGPVGDSDWLDFDALISQLVDEQDEIQPAENEPPAIPGTLGCLRRFLLACRVRTRDDPAALHILAALRRGVDRPATRPDVLQLLTGSAERDDLHPGIQVLSYDEYDGRPCGTLVLLDVHDQGIAVRPKPDPLLTQAALASMGSLDGRAKVDRRLDQLQRACAQAERSVAIVARHDSMGRALVPPIQLRLKLTPSDVGAYGLASSVPEHVERTGLQVCPVDAGPPEATGLAEHLAIQASLEWSRAGRGPTVAPRANDIPGAPTLTHRLYSEPMPAPWLTPWLGNASDVVEAQLALDAPQSASRFFKPLTHCLYQTFVRNQLGIEKPEEVGEELDPREIGQAVHDALEQVATRAPWAASAAELDAVKTSLAEALRGATGSAFDKRRDDFGALSSAREASTRGLEQRWANHWALYASRRVRSAQEDRGDSASADSLVYQHRYVDSATNALVASGVLEGCPPAPRDQVRRWVLYASEDLYNGRGPRFNVLPSAWNPTLENFLKHPTFYAVLRLRNLAYRLTMATRAPVQASAAEVPFGDLGTRHKPAELGLGIDTEPLDLGEIRLILGAEAVPVRGSIDRIDIVSQREGPLARIVDYKTGRSAPSPAQGLRQLMRLVEPQLVIYALVLRQALRDQELPARLDGVTVATVGWDHPRAVKNEKILEDPRDAYPLDDDTLDMLARAIGSLVGEARRGNWALHPHPDTCPQINGWNHDHCPYVGACRFKNHGAKR